MKISSYTPHQCGTAQESMLVLMHAMKRVATKECVFHESYAELGEKEQSAIEFVAPTVFKNFVGGSITIELLLTETDLIRMRHIKQRLQLIKQLVTRYSKLSLDRSACATSPLATQPYKKTVTCFIQPNGWEVVWAKELSGLEQLYITYYQVLQILCTRWESSLHVSVVGPRESLPVKGEPLKENKLYSSV